MDDGAAPRGEPSGTLYVIEPDLKSLSASGFESLEGHSLSPARVLQWVAAWGGRVPQLRLVGCEPATFGADDDPQMELSRPVAEAVDGAISLVRSLIEEFSTAWAKPTDPGQVAFNEAVR
jgi:hydrogenase maturation protease